MKSADRVLIVYCRALPDLSIFSRFRNGLKQRGWRMIVVSHLLSIHLKATYEGIESELVRKAFPSSDYPPLAPESCPECILGLTTTKMALDFQLNLWATLERLVAREPIGGFCQWNGGNIFGQCIRAFAQQYRLPMLFCEIGSIDRNLFVDPQGVNAGSQIARHPELLDSYTVGDDEISRWVERHLARSQRPQILLQAVRAHRINMAFPIDRFGAVICGIPQPMPWNFGKKIWKRIAYLLTPRAPPLLPDRPYLFFPLQVQSDTNLILYSAVDNFAAIEFAAKRAAAEGWQLVIKPHPAEDDVRGLHRIIRLCREHGYLLTSANTTKLVLGAEEIVTINSTVGLEATLLGKRVTVLGQALYQGFDVKRALAFVLRHLVDIDLSKREPAPLAAVDRMLAILEAQAMLAREGTAKFSMLDEH